MCARDTTSTTSNSPANVRQDICSFLHCLPFRSLTCILPLISVVRPARRFLACIPSLISVIHPVRRSLACIPSLISRRPSASGVKRPFNPASCGLNSLFSRSLLYLLFSAYSFTHAALRSSSASARAIASVTCGVAVPPYTLRALTTLSGCSTS